MTSEAPAPDVLEVLRDAVTRAHAAHVLAVGTGDAGAALAVAVAAMLPPRGMLFTVAADADTARRARAHFASAGLADKISVMIGEPSRYLHKLAGPFDVIFQDGDVTHYDSMHDRLVALLRAAGALVTNNVDGAGGYNKRLAADSRLATTFLSAGNGMAVSVKVVERVRP